jgi:hypothetical protein
MKKYAYKGLTSYLSRASVLNELVESRLMNVILGKTTDDRYELSFEKTCFSPISDKSTQEKVSILFKEFAV